MSEPAWTCTRDQLIDALANIEVRGVKVTGPMAGKVIADDVADAILAQIPAALGTPEEMLRDFHESKAVHAGWMSDLASFLAARLDEDEAAAREWHERRCDGCGQRVAARGLYGLVKCITCEPGDLPFSAERPRREIAAKRAIGDRCARFMNEPDQYPNGLVSPRAVLARQVMAGLAAVWSDHPDYDPAWGAAGA